MHRMYLAMKERSPGEITPEVIAIGSGRTELDPVAMAEWLGKYEATATTIQTAFKKQLDAAAGPWEQDQFEKLLVNWIVATDQPFATVDEPEFHKLLAYAHHPSPLLKVPHCDTVKTRIMKLGKDTVKATKLMFQVRWCLLTGNILTSALQNDVDGKISISLDAWTSSNNFAFMAIVAHFITNAGQLEELLIDFRELEGEHSGANLAEATWQTLCTYGIEHRVYFFPTIRMDITLTQTLTLQIMAFMMDNASNNNTLIDKIVELGRTKRIYMNENSAQWIRLRCMPHTVHLAALKVSPSFTCHIRLNTITQLLEGIGAISAADSKKASSRAGNYQDSVTEPVGREHDDNAVGKYDEDEEGGGNVCGSILSGVEKVRCIDFLNNLLILLHRSERLSVQYVAALGANKSGWIK